MATATKARQQAKLLTAPNRDVNQFVETLQPAELAIVRHMRVFVENGRVDQGRMKTTAN